MTSQIPARISASLLCASVLAILLCAAPVLVCAQDTSNTQAKTEQQKLTEAQTRYYDAQAAKLDQERSLSQRIINLSAFLAAIVAVLSLVLNYSSTLRTQRDSQFLEALKRFGDKDSPSVRASAAGLLAKLSDQKGIIVRWRRPNFDIVLDQLMAGLLLEENSVCVASIIDAVRHLTASRPMLVLQRIGAANLRVQKDMVRALAKFLAPITSDENAALSQGNHWSEAATSTPYSEHALRTLALRHAEDFRRECRTAFQEYSLVNTRVREKMVSETQRELSLIAKRLNLNVQLCADLLRSLRSLAPNKIRPLARINLIGVFLVEANLFWAILNKINLESSQLQGAKLHGSSLQGARFFEANLQGADLSKADLQGAILVSVNLEGAFMEEVNLQNASLSFAHLGLLTLRKADGETETKRTYLRKANLEGADLKHADLRGTFAVGANFKAARLGHARLYGADIENRNPYLDDNTSLENADWWTANFLEDDNDWEENNDNSLLEFLFSRYGSEVPHESGKLSSSVRRFREGKTPPAA